jgi:hypothetical protein
VNPSTSTVGHSAHSKNEPSSMRGIEGCTRWDCRSPSIEGCRYTPRAIRCLVTLDSPVQHALLFFQLVDLVVNFLTRSSELQERPQYRHTSSSLTLNGFKGWLVGQSFRSGLSTSRAMFCDRERRLRKRNQATEVRGQQ